MLACLQHLLSPALCGLQTRLQLTITSTDMKDLTVWPSTDPSATEESVTLLANTKTGAVKRLVARVALAVLDFVAHCFRDARSISWQRIMLL